MRRDLKRRLAVGAAFALLLALGAGTAAPTAGAEPSSVQQTVSTTVTTGTTTVTTGTTTTSETTTTAGGGGGGGGKGGQAPAATPAEAQPNFTG